jgi:aldehyde dehydrogenase (NAD+)
MPVTSASTPDVSSAPSHEKDFVVGQVPLGAFFDGKMHPLDGYPKCPTLDPATGRVLAEVPVADAAVVDLAVQSAKRSLSTQWGATLPAQRARILYRAAQLLREDAQRLAEIESMDSGKPLREAKGDIETSARYFEYYAGIADKLQGVTIPLGPDFVSMTLLEPIGVTAHIIPWNFPLVTTARGVAPCLAAGSTAVVKPAEDSPLTALLLGNILKEAGLPDGAYNVVCGPGAVTGAALVGNPDVAQITFTGSVETGKSVMRAAADHVSAVTLELGGKSPVVVLADADLQSAREGVLKAIFTNAGQVCSAGSRLIVEKAVAEEFLISLTVATRALTVGRGLGDPGIGPIISKRQLAKVVGMVSAAKARGVEVLAGGHEVEVAGYEHGNFFAPTILLAKEVADAVVQEEIFGPVLVVQIADDLEHAIELANGTQFGLVAGVYTKDVSKAFQFARRVSAGQVFINQYFAGGVETPFGGTKASGFGREKGLEGLRSYLQVKTITARI